MNFKTRITHNNRVMFLYKDGSVKHTPFTQINYYGDDYILAKGEADIFYTVLDPDGNERADGLKVVHRFQNGLLLTYKSFKKRYLSSDTFEYFINYNIYSVFNFETGKQYTAGIVQSDEITNEPIVDIVHTRYRKTVIKDFLNKPLYCFKDFVFSELLDNQFLITGSLPMANPLHVKTVIAGFPDFDEYKVRKVWSIVDIFTQEAHIDATDIIQSSITGLTFKEAELQLLNRIALPERPDKKEVSDSTIFKDLKAEYTMYRNWKNKNRWHNMINNVLSFARN